MPPHFLLLAVSGCKKDKFNGENEYLIGSWKSISITFGCGTFIAKPENPNLKLEFKKKGNYKLYRGDTKIETGRIVIENGFVTFKCSQKSSELNARKLLNYNVDILNVYRNGCNDDYQFRSAKN